VPAKVPELPLRRVRPHVLPAVNVTPVVSQPHVVSGAPEEVRQRVLAPVENPSGKGEDAGIRIS